MEWIPTIPPGREALSLRLARAIMGDIRGGRLLPGDRLPGARTLGVRLGVHRNTVAAAWKELVAEGWLEARARSGVRVAKALQGGAPAPPALIHRDTSRLLLPPMVLPRAPEADTPGVMVLHGGRPDLRLLPLAALGRAWRRALRGSGRHLVDYGEAVGYRTLRVALARWLREHRGLAVGEGEVIVTRGSQQALHLCARACFAPGSRLAVEALGYPQAWAGFRLAGVELVPVPVDEEGLVVEALEALDVRGVYVTPHHQYPTMVSLSPGRRRALLDWAARRGAVILEDDYDHEFHFAGAPGLPLAAADPYGVVVYIGTLSKALAPGLRIGFVVGPPEVLRRVGRLRVPIDRQGDAVTERAVAELLEEGEVDRHVRRMRKVYAERGVRLAELVEEHLGVPCPPPEGGLALWVRSPVDPAVLLGRCLRRAVGFQIGRDFTLDERPDPHLRLGFSNLDHWELARALAVVGEEVQGLGVSDAASSVPDGSRRPSSPAAGTG